MMRTILAAAAGAAALTAIPANAADWNEKMALCAAAVESGGYADVADYDVKFLSATSRRLKIKLIPASAGEPVVAECTISRGQVSAVEVQA